MSSPEVVPLTGFDALSVPPQVMERGLLEADNLAFNRYIAMHKVFVGQRGAGQLLDLSAQLVDTATPHHLSAAGWAAAEAALILGNEGEQPGGQLLGIANDAWLRAIAHQRWINGQEDHPLADHAFEFRAATDIAFMPVFHELTEGRVQRRTLKNVFEDLLRIAQLGNVRANLSYKEDENAATDLRGFGYEVNGILAYNRRCSGQWFAMPSSSRADSGVYHREQTHDLVVVHLDQGKIIDAVPIEMKGTASKRQRSRYHALLIRSKLHLSLPGQHHPGEVLDAITADYQGEATDRQSALVTKVSTTIYDMVGKYLGGRPRQESPKRTVTQFRDNGRVTSSYPGLL